MPWCRPGGATASTSVEAFLSRQFSRSLHGVQLPEDTKPAVCFTGTGCSRCNVYPQALTSLSSRNTSACLWQACWLHACAPGAPREASSHRSPRVCFSSQTQTHRPHTQQESQGAHFTVASRRNDDFVRHAVCTLSTWHQQFGKACPAVHLSAVKPANSTTLHTRRRARWLLPGEAS